MNSGRVIALGGVDVAKNDGRHCLHGGHGFDQRVWKPEELPDGGLRLTYSSPHGEEGVPGNLRIRTDYRLSNDNTLELEFHATTDCDTVINLTAHRYFHLGGAGRG